MTFFSLYQILELVSSQLDNHSYLRARAEDSVKRNRFPEKLPNWCIAYIPLTSIVTCIVLLTSKMNCHQFTWCSCQHLHLTVYTIYLHTTITTVFVLQLLCVYTLHKSLLWCFDFLNKSTTSITSTGEVIKSSSNTITVLQLNILILNDMCVILQMKQLGWDWYKAKTIICILTTLMPPSLMWVTHTSLQSTCI